ncbi:M20/M25/M40 family metallo-hydrolase [Streptomyces sp. H51]|uniref:M20/M25/M40 family metallo-hydrolase n=1 Tax=Streptomyces sp. H51 TaxID=3111770 RepID=UPI002D76C550|nr:M20/M25/M40 family metallo-hydrolase [Streptomyces sp. H51]
MDSTVASGDGQGLPEKVKGLMGGLTADLMDLVSVRSVYEPDRMTDVREAADRAAKLLAGAGLTKVELLDISGTTADAAASDGQAAKDAPLVYGSYRRPEAAAKAPTVLLYAHYDVVPTDETQWPEAFKPEKDPDTNRLKGRGAADDKSGVMMHVGTLRAFDGKPPVNLTVVLEGEEESGRGSLEAYIQAHPERFKADVIVIADGGNHRLGEPTLTTSLRGFVAMNVTVTTLEHGTKHSGMFGGPAPDAFMALVRMLARLHDNDGNVAVPGLVTDVWGGLQPSEEEFRADAGVLKETKLIGTGTLGSRLYTKPSINVVGLTSELPPHDKPVNQLIDTVTARIGMRIAPREDPKIAAQRLREFLERVDVNPWRARVDVSYDADLGRGFTADEDVPNYQVAKEALDKAYPGKATQYAGQGASIPLVSLLQANNPEAAVLVLGCEEPQCLIHALHESVSLDELERMTLAQSYLLDLLGTLGTPVGSGTDDTRVPVATSSYS